MVPVPTMPQAQRALLVALVCVGLVACGGGGAGTQPTQTTAERTAVPDSLRFSASIVGGGELAGGSLAGRAVMLWFWAPT